MGGLHASNPFSLGLVVLLHVVHLSLSLSLSLVLSTLRGRPHLAYTLAAWRLET